jgi:predicted TIM-barrel fold metal-dependent hydrolase
VILAIGSLICGGVLDDFPKLRVAFLEAGAGFLPYLFDRLNEVATEEPEYTKISIKKLPTEYLDRLWFSLQHQNGIEVDSVLESLETISARDKEKLMGLNAVRLFDVRA